MTKRRKCPTSLRGSRPGRTMAVRSPVGGSSLHSSENTTAGASGRGTKKTMMSEGIFSEAIDLRRVSRDACHGPPPCPSHDRSRNSRRSTSFAACSGSWSVLSVIIDVLSIAKSKSLRPSLGIAASTMLSFTWPAAHHQHRCTQRSRAADSCLFPG